jgi:hypothetical protein
LCQQLLPVHQGKGLHRIVLIDQHKAVVQGGSQAIQAGRHIAQQVPARLRIALFF